MIICQQDEYRIKNEGLSLAKQIKEQSSELHHKIYHWYEQGTKTAAPVACGKSSNNRIEI
jgi:hypothetical protein